MSIFPMDRLVRGVHYRLGQYIGQRDHAVRRQIETTTARRISTISRKINVGCGYDKRPGYLNIDIEPAVSPDILIVNDDDSMIPRNHFEEVLAMDVLEHFPRTKTLATLLNWADYLVDGGKLTLQTSSILALAEKLKQSARYEDQHSWTQCLFGTQAQRGDYHFTGFTELTLRVHLLAAGFRVDRMGLEDEWLLTAEATKVEDWIGSFDIAAGSDAEFMREAYRRALFRDVEGDQLDMAIRPLKSGTPRIDVLRAIYTSTERLFRVAAREGL